MPASNELSGTTGEAVSAIQAIGSTIAEIDGISNDIAAAIDQQRAKLPAAYNRRRTVPDDADQGY